MTSGTHYYHGVKKFDPSEMEKELKPKTMKKILNFFVFGVCCYILWYFPEILKFSKHVIEKIFNL